MSISPFISNITQSYLGVQVSDPQGEELLNEFKALIGLKPEDPLPSGDTLVKDPYAPPDVAGQTAPLDKVYTAFLAHKLTSIYFSESQNALSPAEVEARDIIFEVFSMALEMLGALQDCMRMQSKNMEFYAKWQDEITRMMTQTPVYGPLCQYKIVPDNNDFGNTKLGYANVTVRQAAEHLYKKLQEVDFDGDEREINWNHRDPTLAAKLILPNITYDFYLKETKNTDGSSSFTFQVRMGTSDDPFVLLSDQVDVLPEGQEDGLYGQAYISTLINSLMVGITEEWNTKDPSTIVLSPPTNLQVPNLGAVTFETLKENPGYYIFGPWEEPTPGAWPETDLQYAYDPNDDEEVAEVNNKRNASSSFRSEINAQLQLYIQKADAIKQRIRDMSKSTETIVNSTREAIQAQANLLSAITESLRSMLSAIFR